MPSFLFLIFACIFGYSQAIPIPIFVPGDLVQIVAVKPQKNASAKVRELIQLFDYSFGFVTKRTFNKKMKRFECTVEHFEDRSKKLKIKEKYLRLLPIIRLHAGDAVSDDFDILVYYWRYISKGTDQCTFNVAQLGPKLWMEAQDEHIKDNMIRSVITQSYTMYVLLHDFLHLEASIDNFIRIVQLMPTVMRRRFLNPSMQRVQELGGDYSNVLLQFEQILSQCPGWSTEMEAALHSLNNASVEVFLDEMRAEFDTIWQVWSGVMNARHGTDNFAELFCLDIVRNYQENELVAVRGTFNVILWNHMDPNLLKKRIIERLLQYPEYYGSVALVEHIVQITDGQLSSLQKLLHCKRAGHQTKIKIILWMGFFITYILFMKTTLFLEEIHHLGDFNLLERQSPLSLLYFLFIYFILVFHAFMLLTEHGKIARSEHIAEEHLVGKMLVGMLKCWNFVFVRFE